jgi:hypothetical protein
VLNFGVEAFVGRLAAERAEDFAAPTENAPAPSPT